MRSVFSRITVDAIEFLENVAPNAVVNLARPVKHRALLARVRIRMMQGGERLKPSFLIIGAQKAGTSALFRYLIRHPEIVSPLVKEVHYFDFNSARPPVWYFAHFPRMDKVSPEMITGEASPYYLPHPKVAERVARTLPDVKVIVLLRDPVKRAISHYFHEKRVGWETRPMREALTADESWLAPDLKLLEESDNHVTRSYVHHSYIARGLYADQLRIWFNHFDRSRILVLRSEDLLLEPRASYARTLEFLGLDFFEIGRMEPHYVGKYGKIDSAIRSELSEIYAEPNRRLQDLLGVDFGWSETD